MSIAKTVMAALGFEQESLEQQHARESAELAHKQACAREVLEIRRKEAALVDAVAVANEKYESFCAGVDADCKFDVAAAVRFRLIAVGFGTPGIDWRGLAATVKSAEALREIAPEIKMVIREITVSRHEKELADFRLQYRHVLKGKPLPAAQSDAPAVSKPLPLDYYNSAECKEATRLALGQFKPELLKS